ncbi:MAG: M55 family metallopeptidase [Bacillota bacterium]|jgi:D-amino peptidase
MRVYISVDMEGVAGVAHEDQTDPTDPRHAAEYARSCRLMTGEANAAIEGALAAGATAVCVNDSHWLMRNLIADELHEAAELISGGPKLYSMVEGIDGGFDAALFIGYHARAGTGTAVIDHTYTDRVHEVRVNGLPFGEVGLNAALAGSFGVPVALVSGDRALAAETRELLGDHVETVVVKEPLGRYAARSAAPAVARRRIHDGVRRTLEHPHQPFTVTSPVTFSVDFARSQMAEMAALIPGSRRVGGRTVEYTHADYRDAFKAFRAMYNLAGTE